MRGICRARLCASTYPRGYCCARGVLPFLRRLGFPRLFLARVLPPFATRFTFGRTSPTTGAPGYGSAVRLGLAFTQPANQPNLILSPPPPLAPFRACTCLACACGCAGVVKHSARVCAPQNRLRAQAAQDHEEERLRRDAERKEEARQREANTAAVDVEFSPEDRAAALLTLGKIALSYHDQR